MVPVSASGVEDWDVDIIVEIKGGLIVVIAGQFSGDYNNPGAGWVD